MWPHTRSGIWDEFVIAGIYIYGQGPRLMPNPIFSRFFRFLFYFSASSSTLFDRNKCRRMRPAAPRAELRRRFVLFFIFFSTILFYFICFFLCGRFSGSVPTWSFFSVFYPLWCMCVFSWCCECGSSCGCNVCIQVFSCVLISWSNMFFHKIKLILISKSSK